RLVAADDGLAVRLKADLFIPVPPKAGIQLAADTPVTMGLRTEDLGVDDGDTALPDGWKFDGIVDVVEPLGSETNLHIDITGVRFVAKCDGRRQVRVGDRLSLGLNLKHLHLFDGESRASIY
ncbi:MAG: TOBE domain-containing protein, partial [Deltaproteobacteria bacterium]